MPVKYFADHEDYPNIVKAILERCLVHVASFLYKDEYDADPAKSLDRIILSDSEAGTDVSIGDAIEKFEAITYKIPFTTYLPRHPERREHTGTANYRHLLHDVFMDEVGKKATALPMTMPLPMISFFQKASDYRRATTLFNAKDAVLNRIRVPIKVGEIETSFPIDIKFEIAKGEYASEFEKYLTQNRIFDILHTLQINYYDLIFEGGGVYPVDDIIVSIGYLDENDQGNVLTSITVPHNPTVVSTNPADGDEAVAVDSNIVVTFDKIMYEPEVQNAFSIEPFVEGDFEWDAMSNVMTFRPDVNLASETEFTVTLIASETRDQDEQSLEEDYVFTFKTV